MIIYDQPAYPITYVQPNLWKRESIKAINDAAHTVAERLSVYTELPLIETFAAVFGTRVRTWFTPSLVGMDAFTKWGIIRWAGNDKVTWELAIHEFMHLFCARTYNRPLRGIARLDTIAGSKIPGCHPPSRAGYNLTEKFCNAGEVWVRELYAENPAGCELASWFNVNMFVLTKIAMGRAR